MNSQLSGSIQILCALDMPTAQRLFTAFLFAGILHGQTAEADFTAAERLFQLDNYAKARPFWVRAEAEFTAQGNPAKATYARVSRLRGDSETILSYPAVSQEIAQLLDTRLVRANPELRLRCLIVKAAADLSSKDPESSGRVFTEALETAQSLHDQFWIGRVTGELAVIAFLKGDTAKAVELNARAFQIAKSLNDLQGEVRQRSLEGVGLLEQQRYDDALIRFDDALSFARMDRDVRFPLMAYMGKAQALEAQGDLPGSATLLQQALKFVETADMRVYKADLLLALAGRAIKQKRTNDAEALLDQAAKAATEAGMPRPYAEANLRMTELYMAAGDFQHAETSMRKCVNASRQLVDMYFLPQHLALAAEIEARLNNVQQADEDYEEAENLVESMLLNVPTASVKASLIATMDTVFRGHFELAIKQNQIPTAFRILERVRGRVVADNLRAQPQTTANDGNHADEELNRIQGELFRTTNVARRSQLVEQLQHAEEQLDLTTLSQNRARFSIHGKPVDLPTLQQRLEADEAVLEYVMDDQKSYCLVITSTSVKHYELAGRSAVEKAIAAYLSDTTAMRDSESAKLLYRQLFAPIEEYRAKSQIIVVPDGQLGFIPFDALIDENGKYALLGHTVSYVPSATVLALLRDAKRAPEAPTLLAIGASNAPKANGDSFGRAAHGLFDPENPARIEALPSVNGEVHEITQIFGQRSDPIVGPTASEAAFKSRNLEQYQVIHIAAHGFADLKFPDRSGLFLGFDHDRRDDGLLQIREIRDLRLRADLVTLSACDAGAGKLEGQNGIASLVQAFLFAGARSVVASLWTANDAFTAALMARFYRDLGAGMPVGRALRSAKIEMLDRFGSKAVPLLWAGFFVTGDPATYIFFNKSNDEYRTTN